MGCVSTEEEDVGGVGLRREDMRVYWLLGRVGTIERLAGGGGRRPIRAPGSVSRCV